VFPVGRVFDTHFCNATGKIQKMVFLLLSFFPPSRRDLASFVPLEVLSVKQELKHIASED